jgi:hypothetical protein
MFRIEDRERIKEMLIEKARSDPRVIAAAAVGSSAGGGDRWSDIDLTFGVADGMSVEAVLATWTQSLEAEFDAVVLFDLPVLSTIYRVFLFPGILQVDLSFTPTAEFGAWGPRFRLLFGEAVQPPRSDPPPSENMFGLGVHHAVRAHICIERGRPWQAQYWIQEARAKALSLACRRVGIDASYGRGYDDLPPEVRDGLAGALVGNLTVNELRRALAVVVAGLLREAGDTPEVVGRVRPMLEELCHPAPI